ncbi:MAG: tetratricopeptide repeat protein [Bacteroidetes bacterium]|nr:tetratricopeptide repeat protein [Bacteroidota bacterium]
MHKLFSFLLMTTLAFSSAVYGQNSNDQVTLGNQAMNEGRYRDAQLHYEAALAKDPQNAEIYTMLGFSYHKQRYLRKADSIYRISIGLDSNASRVHWYKGMNHIALKQDSSAIVCYKKFIDLEKGRGGRLLEAYRAIGQSYERMLRKEGLYSWQIDEMIYYYELIEQADPSFIEVPLIRNFVELVKSKRPANQEGKWKLES